MTAAHTICETPSSDDAVPARCGNGIMAPAIGLRLHQPHADGVDRHRGDERDRRRAAERNSRDAAPSPPIASATAPMPIVLSSPMRVDDARRERGAGEIAAARRREGKPERERREAVDLLQHEGRAGNPREHAGEAHRQHADIGEHRAVAHDLRDSRRRIARSENGPGAGARSVSGSLRHTKNAAISPNAICSTKCERQPNALCSTPPIIGANTGASAMMAPISDNSRPARAPE